MRVRGQPTAARTGTRMPSIDVSTDVLDFLLSQTSYFGESADSILRRLLLHPGESEPPLREKSPALDTSEFAHSGMFRSTEHTELEKLLSSTRFRTSSTVAERFLLVLSCVLRHHPDPRSTVLSIRGRKRLYFAPSARELNEAGTSVNPQQIPRTGLWAVTNNDTPTKRSLLKRVLTALSYPDALVDQAVQALE